MDPERVKKVLTETLKFSYPGLKCLEESRRSEPCIIYLPESDDATTPIPVGVFSIHWSLLTDSDWKAHGFKLSDKAENGSYTLKPYDLGPPEERKHNGSPVGRNSTQPSIRELGFKLSGKAENRSYTLKPYDLGPPEERKHNGSPMGRNSTQPSIRELRFKLSDKAENGSYTLKPYGLGPLEERKHNESPVGRNGTEPSVREIVANASRLLLPGMNPDSRGRQMQFSELYEYRDLIARLGLVDKAMVSLTLYVETENANKMKEIKIWVRVCNEPAQGAEGAASETTKKKKLETTMVKISRLIPLDTSLEKIYLIDPIPAAQYAIGGLKNAQASGLLGDENADKITAIGRFRHMGYVETYTNGYPGTFQPLETQNLVAEVPTTFIPGIPEVAEKPGQTFELWTLGQVIEGLENRRFGHKSAIALAHFLTKEKHITLGRPDLERFWEKFENLFGESFPAPPEFGRTVPAVPQWCF